MLVRRVGDRRLIGGGRVFESQAFADIISDEPDDMAVVFTGTAQEQARGSENGERVRLADDNAALHRQGPCRP